MAGTAARFYPETHQLFINAGYPGFDAFRGILEAEFAAAEDQETMRMTALTVSEHVLIRQICRKLVFALSKRDVWKPWEVDQATSMYSLTLAVDDSVALLDEARAEMRKQIGATTLDPKLERARSRFRLGDGGIALPDLAPARRSPGRTGDAPRVAYSRQIATVGVSCCA